MDLIACLRQFMFTEVPHELFEAGQLRGIHARVREAQGLREAVASVEAAVLNGHETDVSRTGHVHQLGKGIHGSSDPPRARAAGQHHHAEPSHN